MNNRTIIGHFDSMANGTYRGYLPLLLPDGTSVSIIPVTSSVAGYTVRLDEYPDIHIGEAHVRKTKEGTKNLDVRLDLPTMPRPIVCKLTIEKLAPHPLEWERDTVSDVAERIITCHAMLAQTQQGRPDAVSILRTLKGYCDAAGQDFDNQLRRAGIYPPDEIPF